MGTTQLIPPQRVAVGDWISSEKVSVTGDFEVSYNVTVRSLSRDQTCLVQVSLERDDGGRWSAQQTSRIEGSGAEPQVLPSHARVGFHFWGDGSYRSRSNRVPRVDYAVSLVTGCNLEDNSQQPSPLPSVRTLMEILVKIAYHLGLWLLNPKYHILAVDTEHGLQVVLMPVGKIDFRKGCVWMEVANEKEQRLVYVPPAESLQKETVSIAGEVVLLLKESSLAEEDKDG